MMNPYERHLAVINGEEPDRVDIVFAMGLRTGPSRGIVRRLSERGMGITHTVPPYKPMFFFDNMINPFDKDISYIQKSYFENNMWMIQHIFETPVGRIDSIVGLNPGVNVSTHAAKTHFIKNVEDWRVINYIFEKMINGLTPNYEEIISEQEDFGTKGTTIAMIDRTPFQRAWLELASLERTALDFKMRPDLFLEYIDIQRRFHEKAAEITAGCPANQIIMFDNITNVISPKNYREYCMPYYEIYSNALSGTGKRLAIHHDGLIRHIVKEIQESSFDILDSLTIPPTGNVTVSEAREFFPDKVLTVNLPPHLAYATIEELHLGYEKILAEHGKKCLIIEHVEDMPEEVLENHLSAALDVSGY
jgi:hypothetical protein